jgi:hypothetical protein
MPSAPYLALAEAEAILPYVASMNTKAVALL